MEVRDVVGGSQILNEEESGEFVSRYARYFDEECYPKWTNDPKFNLLYLKTQQNYANDLLKSKGHVLLNEVYEMLGMPKTKDGEVVGWFYDEDNPNGDNYVDFGIYDERNRDFINGYENRVLLDFNVDGFIFDKI